jgi:hypothetical protein
MDHAARVAFIQAQTVCAIADIEAMKATNRRRRLEGGPDYYKAADFRAVPDKFGLGHNAVIQYLSGY